MLKRYFTPRESTSARINNFNFLRMIAAFLVIYGHMNAIMGQAQFPLLGQRISSIGVKMLFTVSGFLITKSFLSDRCYPRYLVRRAMRIFPPLALLCLLSVFVLGPITTTLSLSDYFGSVTTWQYFKNLLLSPVYLLPGVFTHNTYPDAVNGSLWTLPVEFALYLLLPLLLLLFSRLRRLQGGVILCAVAATVASVLQGVCFDGVRFVLYGTNWPDAIPLLPFYFIGASFSFAPAQKYLNLQGALVLLLGAAILGHYPVIGELSVILAISYTTLSFSLCPMPLFSHWFEKNDFAYGVYLYAFPIQQALWSVLVGRTDSALLLSLLSFCVTLPFALLSCYTVERAASRAQKRILARMNQKTTAIASNEIQKKETTT